MVTKVDSRPPHQQIAAHIRAEILSGELEPGAQIDTTQRLMAKFSVTNQTVQRALKVLKDEGFLVGKSGSGVYVRPKRQQVIVPEEYVSPAAPGEAYPWTTEARRRGQRDSTRLIDVAEVRPPARVAAVFGLPPDGVAVMRHRVLLLDDEPTEVSWSYHPVELARGTAIADRKLVKGGTPRVLADLGYEPMETIDRISVRLPTSAEFIALELTQDVPVLCTFRVVLSVDRRPIEVSVLVKAGYLYELEYRISKPQPRA